MFSAFFGNYLLNKGVVSSEQLSRVLESQKQVRLKLGTLAINAGLMNANQVEEVHDFQAREDKRFGEIAIQKGYLNIEQLNNLLMQQKAENLILAQALIDEGLMTIEHFEKEIANYKKEHGLSDEQFDFLKNNNVDMIVRSFIDFEDNELSNYYSEYVSLFLKNMIRFIDTNIRIDCVKKIDTIHLQHYVEQEITGDTKIFTAIAGEEQPLVTLAGRYAEETFTQMEEYPIDALGEFLNLHNGLFTVNMSNNGVEMGLVIQSYHKDSTLSPKGNLYHIPVYTSFGVIDLIIGQ